MNKDEDDAKIAVDHFRVSLQIISIVQEKTTQCEMLG